MKIIRKLLKILKIFLPHDIEIQINDLGYGGYLFIPLSSALYGINEIKLSKLVDEKIDFSVSVKELNNTGFAHKFQGHNYSWAIGIHIDGKSFFKTLKTILIIKRKLYKG